MDNLDYVKELLNELSDFSHSQTVNLVPVQIPKEFLTTILSCREKQCWIIWESRLEIHIEDASPPDSSGPHKNASGYF